jgi:plastocyanin
MHAFDSRTGLPLLKRNLAVDTGGSATDPGSQGISIARNTVYAASSEFVVAYRPGAGGGPGGPGLPELPALPGPGGMTVVAVPGSVTTTYGTPVAFVQADNPRLSFLNLDLSQHDVDHRPAGGPSLFQSDLAGLGDTVRVNFTGALQAGSSYEFYCSLHPNMTGQLLAI